MTKRKRFLPILIFILYEVLVWLGSLLFLADSSLLVGFVLTVCGLTVLLAVCAWGDPAHRAFLAPAAVLSLVATVIAGIRGARERARWDELGRQE